MKASTTYLTLFWFFFVAANAVLGIFVRAAYETITQSQYAFSMRSLLILSCLIGILSWCADFALSMRKKVVIRERQKA